MVKTVKMAKTLEDGVWTVCLARTVKAVKEKTLKDRKQRH